MNDMQNILVFSGQRTRNVQNRRIYRQNVSDGDLVYTYLNESKLIIFNLQSRIFNSLSDPSILTMSLHGNNNFILLKLYFNDLFECHVLVYIYSH